MKDMGLERILKSCEYEILEDGLRLKVFGLPYKVGVEDLEGAIHWLHNLHERILIIKKEKQDLSKGVEKRGDVLKS